MMNFYKRNMKIYGEQEMLFKLAEECGELRDAIMTRLFYCHKGMPENSAITILDHVAEEMADVQIVLNQFKTLNKYSDKIKHWKAAKIRRQKGRWKDAKNNR